MAEKQKRQQKLLKSRLLFKKIAILNGKLLQNYKWSECKTLRIFLKHVSDNLSMLSQIARQYFQSIHIKLITTKKIETKLRWTIFKTIKEFFSFIKIKLPTKFVVFQFSGQQENRSSTSRSRNVSWHYRTPAWIQRTAIEICFLRKLSKYTFI